MSAGCARCGWCCDPVWLDSLAFDQLCSQVGQPDADPNAAFVAEHWHPIGPAEDDGWMPLRCDAYDPQARLCAAREDRPPVCRDYPWYRGAPTPKRARFMNPQCSYLADLPPDRRPEGSRPLIPLMPV